VATAGFAIAAKPDTGIAIAMGEVMSVPFAEGRRRRSAAR
jgi:hypothetical protein